MQHPTSRSLGTGTAKEWGYGSQNSENHALNALVRKFGQKHFSLVVIVTKLIQCNGVWAAWSDCYGQYSPCNYKINAK
jgi:hypothetical protein